MLKSTLWVCDLRLISRQRLMSLAAVGAWACMCMAIMISFVAFPTRVHANDLADSACTGIDEALGGGTCASNDTTQIDSTIQTAVNIISVIASIIAVIMIIIGGFRYITSNGDSGSVSGAKNTIIYAVVGLIIVAFSQIIVRFTVGRVTS